MPTLELFTVRMPFLSPKQQCQSEPFTSATSINENTHSAVKTC